MSKLVKQTLPWCVKQFVKMVDNGTARFDNAIQRTYIWDKYQNSLLIHSILTGYPIPPFYANKWIDEDNVKIFDFLDGKQRTHAISSYIKGEYMLEGIPAVDGEDINGRYFSNLSEEMQDDILMYSLSIVYYDDLNDDEIAELFLRLNNGKSMSSIELNRVKAPAIDQIKEIAKHTIFDSYTTKAKARYADEDVVFKAFAMLKMEEPCLDMKEIRPFMKELIITENDKELMTKVLNKILTAHNFADAKTGKKIYKKTNLVSLVPFVSQHLDEDIREFIQYFFKCEGPGSISTIYNDNANSGSGHKERIKARLDEIDAEYNSWIEQKRDQFVA